MSVERYAVADILRGTGQDLSVQWYLNGQPVDPGTVTVTVTDADGNMVVEDEATDGTMTDPRTYTLTPADTAQLTMLTAVWTSAGSADVAADTAVTTYAEIVGDLLFTLNELRSFDNNKFSDVNDYPNETLRDARSRIRQQFEDICEVAFGTAYRRVTLDGNGRSRISVPNIYVSAVRSVETRTRGSQVWTVFTPDDLDDVQVDEGNYLYRESRGVFPKGVQNVRVGYEHGHARIPFEIRNAAMMVAVSSVIPSDVDPRAVSYFDGFSTIRYVVPGLTRGAFTSLPEVNEILNRYRDRVPRVA